MPNRLAKLQSRGFVRESEGMEAADIASALSKSAVLSLYKEVSLYPKPGLVSPIDSGSHNDMNYQMFLASC